MLGRLIPGLLAALLATAAQAQVDSQELAACRRAGNEEVARYDEAVKLRAARGPLLVAEQQALDQKMRRLRELLGRLYATRLPDECRAGLAQLVEERGPLLNVAAPVPPSPATNVVTGSAADCVASLNEEVFAYESVTRQFGNARLPVAEQRPVWLDNVRRFRELAAAAQREPQTCPAALAQLRSERPALLALVYVPPKAPAAPAAAPLGDAACRSDIDRQLRVMAEIVRLRGGQQLGDAADLAQLQERYARMEQLRWAAGPGFQELGCTAVLAGLARERGVMLGWLDVLPPATPPVIAACAATLRREIAPLEDAVARGVTARLVDRELHGRVDAALRDMRSTLHQTTTDLLRFALAGDDAEVNRRCNAALSGMVKRNLPAVADLNLALSAPRRADKPAVVSPDLQACADDLQREQQVVQDALQQVAKLGVPAPAELTLALDGLKRAENDLADSRRWTAGLAGRCRSVYAKTVLSAVPAVVNVSIGLATARPKPAPVVDPQLAVCQADLRGERAAYDGLLQRLRERAPTADFTRFDARRQKGVADPETLDLTGQRLAPDRCREQYYTTVQTLAPLMAELGRTLAQSYARETAGKAPLRR